MGEPGTDFMLPFNFIYEEMEKMDLTDTEFGALSFPIKLLIGVLWLCHCISANIALLLAITAATANGIYHVFYDWDTVKEQAQEFIQKLTYTPM